MPCHRSQQRPAMLMFCLWRMSSVFMAAAAASSSSNIRLTPSPTMTPVPSFLPVFSPLAIPAIPPPGSTLSPTKTMTSSPTKIPKGISYCKDAPLLGLNQTLDGTTIHPTPPNIYTYINAGKFKTGGLWNKFVGTGGFMRVDTCNFADFPTTIEVYVGDTCESLQLVNSVGGNCGEFGGRQDWSSTKGTTYYALVYGQGKKGSFQIKLSEEPPLANDLCPNAAPILAGQILTLDLTDATPQNVPQCGRDTQDSINTLGAWFYFQSSGPSRIVANTCRSGDSLTTISVFTGPCDKLGCVAGTGYYCNITASRVEWESETATDYLILVHGPNSFTANVLVELEEVPATPTVSPAPSLTLNIPPPVVDPTVPTPPQTPPSLANATAAPSPPAPKPSTSTLVTPAPTYNIPPVVPSPPQSPPSLANATGVPSSPAPKPSTSILVTPAPIGLPLAPVGPPITPPSHLSGNELCDGAVFISVGQSINGSTFHANGIQAQRCNGSTKTGGVWYKFIGTGAKLKVDTCDLADYGSTISVFVGSSCNSLQCVGANTGLRSAGALVPFESVAGAMYYVLVQRAESLNGYFTLKLSEDVPVVNDLCPNAIPIASGEIVSGRTNEATPDYNITICNGNPSLNPTPGVWYHYRSSAEPTRIVASTCTGYFVEDFVPAISVYKGPCDQLECITGNGNFCRSGSRAAWESDGAADYYILVYGPQTFSCGNNFELELTAVPATPTVSPAPSLNLNLGVAVSQSFIPTPLPPYSLSPTMPSIQSQPYPTMMPSSNTAAPFMETTTGTGNPYMPPASPSGFVGYYPPFEMNSNTPKRSKKGKGKNPSKGKGKKGGDLKGEKKGGKGDSPSKGM